MHTAEHTLQAAAALVDDTYGIIQRVSVGEAPPGEPMVYTATVDRETPAEITDGRAFTPTEGGCSLDRTHAVAAGVGEAVERYCASIYDADGLVRGTADEVDDAIDPNTVATFDPDRQSRIARDRDLYAKSDRIRWVEASRHPDGAQVRVPAQLVYLNYDEPDESTVRDPISTGLAAGMEERAARRRGILEVIERDAFMVYYLTKTALPTIELDTATAEIRTLTDRLDRAGLQWTLLDARTDLDVPVVVAVLVDRGPGPTVSVAASAHTAVSTAVERSLLEAIQTRLYQRYLLENGENPVALETVPVAEIDRKTRVLGWSHERVAATLSFWTDADETVPLSTISEQSDTPSHTDFQRKANAAFTFYVSELTTPDVEDVGFTVVRAMAPSAQPLYLAGRNRYWDTTRLEAVPTARGHDSFCPSTDPINDYPHPFP